LAAPSDGPETGPGVELDALAPVRSADALDYGWVRLAIDRGKRVATLTVRAPDGGEPDDPPSFLEAGSRAWAIAAWRELDDALLLLRFSETALGVVLLDTQCDS